MAPWVRRARPVRLAPTERWVRPLRRVALTCTIAAGQGTCTDLASSVTFANGDLFSLRYDETGAPNVRIEYSVLYQAP